MVIEVFWTCSTKSVPAEKSRAQTAPKASEVLSKKLESTPRQVTERNLLAKGLEDTSTGASNAALPVRPAASAASESSGDSESLSGSD